LHPHRHFNHTLTPTEEVTETNYGYKRSACIQTWEPFHNLADAWTLLRAVERKYGKVLEAQFIKDYEMTNRYQMFSYVCFLDPKSRDKIPKSGYTFKIPPPVMEDRPGGPGLDDIKHLLESVDEVEFSLIPKGRVIGARIFSTPGDYFTVPKMHPISPNKPLSKAFLKWRGFHKPEPFADDNEAWFGKPVWERMAMTAAMDRCSKMAEVRNPGLRKPKTNKNDGKVSESSSASTSMDSPEPSSPTTLEVPTQSHSLSTKLPQPLSQAPGGPTQLPLKPTPPNPAITPEQKNTKERQMDRAQQVMAQTKKWTSKKKSRKSNKEPEEKLKDQQLDKSPEEPLESASKGIVAAFWKMVGR